MIIDEVVRSQADHPSLAGMASRALTRLWELLGPVVDAGTTYLNFVLSDGEEAVVARITTSSHGQAQSLHYIQGHRYECKGSVCRIHHDDPDSQTIIFSSEPLSQQDSWSDVEINTLYHVQNARITGRDPVAVPVIG